MDWVLAILLFLHVGGAIVAFGPTFVFPVILAMGGKEPQHVNFGLRLVGRISERIVFPLAVFQGVTGVLLIWKAGYNLFATGWLLLSIILYVISLSISFFVAIPNVRKLIEATSTPPPPPPAGSPPPSGPPPHIAAMVKKGRQAGMATAALLVAIIFLMAAKPTF